MLYTSDYLETLPEDSFLRSNYVENHSTLQELESLLTKQLSKKNSCYSRSIKQSSKPTSATSSLSVNITPVVASKTLRELELAGTSKPTIAGSLGARPLPSSEEPGQRKWGRLVNVSGTVPTHGYSLYQLSLILGKGFGVDDLTAIQSSLNSFDEHSNNFVAQDCAVVGKRLSPSPNPKHLPQPFASTVNYSRKLRTSVGTKVGKRRRKIQFAGKPETPDDASKSALPSPVEHRPSSEDLHNTLNSCATTLNIMDKHHDIEAPLPTKELLDDSDSTNAALGHGRNIRFSEDEFEDDATLFSEGLEFDDVIQSHGRTLNDTDIDTPSPDDWNLSSPDYLHEYLQRTLRDKSSRLTTTTDTDSCTSSQDSLRVFYDDTSHLDLTSSGTISTSNEPCSQPSNEGAHPPNQRSPLASFPGKLGKSSVQRSQTSSNIRTKLNEKRDKPGSMPSVAYNAPKRPQNL